MPNPLTSILIPVFNREEIIKTTLDSIKNQTFVNWECILVDDGSSDTTESTIQSYIKADNRFQYYKRPNNLPKGANSCRNYAFTKAKGALINWFDSDDIMMPDFLQTKINAFKDTTHAVMHRNQYSNYDLTRFRDSKFEHSGAHSLFYHYVLDHIEMQTCAFMWRKNYLEGKPLFNETMQRYQDNEFHIRMLANHPEVVILDQVLATVRGGGGDDSQISAKVNITKQKLYDIFFYRYQSYMLAQKALDKTQKEDVCKVVSKKALWSFYDMLRFQKSIKQRFYSVKQHGSKLNSLYLGHGFTFIDRLKSHVYLFYLIIFGSSKYKH